MNRFQMIKHGFIFIPDPLGPTTAVKDFRGPIRCRPR